MTGKTVEEFLFGEAGVVRLIGEMKYKHALRIILEEGEQFPELKRTINYYRVCLAATLEDTSQAYQVLEDLLKIGIFYPPVLLGTEADPTGLEPIIGHPRFEKLKEMHANGYWEPMEKALPILKTVMPELPPQSLPPLLVALHGNVSYIQNEIEFYHSVTENGWLLAMPQSSQP